MKNPSTDFAGNVNRTLKELLGQRKKMNNLVEFRNLGTFPALRPFGGNDD